MENKYLLPSMTQWEKAQRYEQIRDYLQKQYESAANNEITIEQYRLTLKRASYEKYPDYYCKASRKEDGPVKEEEVFLKIYSTPPDWNETLFSSIFLDYGAKGKAYEQLPDSFKAFAEENIIKKEGFKPFPYPQTLQNLLIKQEEVKNTIHTEHNAFAQKMKASDKTLAIEQEMAEQHNKEKDYGTTFSPDIPFERIKSYCSLVKKHSWRSFSEEMQRRESISDFTGITTEECCLM